MTTEKKDILYNLLPYVYRMRDHEQGEPLRAVLQVIAEQVSIVEEDIERLYDNWFIETCEEWVVPYIGALVGYKPVSNGPATLSSSDEELRAALPVLVPRRDVAATVYSRRRKGTLALLEELSFSVAGWPGRAVEFYALMGWAQNINHLRSANGRLVDLHDNDALNRIDTPFDSIARSVDVRRIVSTLTTGRFNIPSVGLFVWRLATYSITKVPACCIEEAGPHCYTFSILGHDMQLFAKPLPEPDPTHIAKEENLPVAIRRWAFDREKELYYGEDKSMAVWVRGWGKYNGEAPLPPNAVIPANLTDWSYRPPANHVAIDPVLGRIVFPPDQAPRHGVRVSFRYGFSADMGGGEYARTMRQPEQYVIVRVGEQEPVKKITAAWNSILEQWENHPDEPQNGIIEIIDSGVYVEQLIISLKPSQSLIIRAANRTRPVLRLIDWQSDMPDALRVTVSDNSSISFEGLLIAGRPISLRPAENGMDFLQEKSDEPDTKTLCPPPPFTPAPAALVNLRHCTVVPGWGLYSSCEPKRGAEPCIECCDARIRLTIEKCIIGSIQIQQNQVRTDPVSIIISDSIIDSTSCTGEAIGAPGRPVAHAILTIRRSTVFGTVLIHALELAEDSIFTDCLCVARRQLGCMRFCYVPPRCRTPRRYRCQPDLAIQKTLEKLLENDPDAPASEIATVKAREEERVKPLFNSMRYGRHDYSRLSDLCAKEISRGAEDESEMGAFHDLYTPQRSENLRSRLEEYTPADMDAGIINVT